MTTYPKYPQPILNQSSTGLNWYLELTNSGVLSAKATTTDVATTIRNVTLVSSDRTKSFRLGLDGTTPPAITVTEVPVKFGNFDEVNVFSLDGREWGVTLDNVGAMTITPLGVEWDRLQYPIIEDPTGKPWKYTVSDGGIYSVDDEGVPAERRAMIVRDKDNTKAWKAIMNTPGVITMTDVGVSLSDTDVYDVELISPMGNRWMLYVDGGIIKIESIDDLVSSGASWPLVMEQKSGMLYVVDNRFRRPRFGGRG